MNIIKTSMLLAVLIFTFAFIGTSNAEDICDRKFTVESKGSMMGGMGDVNTVMYRKSCDEFVQKQVTSMSGMNMEQLIVHKDGYVYTNNNGNWSKTKQPDAADFKKMRDEGKSEKDIIIALGGKPLNKNSNEYLEPCSYWEFFGSTVCYTSDFIPVNVKNQMMEINATKITRGDAGPAELYNVPDNVPETDFMQGGMPDMDKIMKDAMKEIN